MSGCCTQTHLEHITTDFDGGEMSAFFQLLRKRKELIPLIGIVGMAAAFATCTSFYFLLTKSDVVINRSGPEPWERIDPAKPQKLMTINQEWKPVPELEYVKNLTK